jgi:hypothetical protein
VPRVRASCVEELGELDLPTDNSDEMMEWLDEGPDKRREREEREALEEWGKILQRAGDDPQMVALILKEEHGIDLKHVQEKWTYYGGTEPMREHLSEVCISYDKYSEYGGPTAQEILQDFGCEYRGEWGNDSGSRIWFLFPRIYWLLLDWLEPDRGQHWHDAALDLLIKICSHEIERNQLRLARRITDQLRTNGILPHDGDSGKQIEVVGEVVGDGPRKFICQSRNAEKDANR